MYNITFIREDGVSLAFNYDSGIIVTTMGGVTGRSVDLSLSQGYQQVGENVDSASVGGVYMTVNGFILDGDTDSKKRLLSVLRPKANGRLYWHNKDADYFVDAWVSTTPEITQTKHSRWSFILFVPYPYWLAADPVSVRVGDVTPSFSFPVNYSSPHVFGAFVAPTNVTVVNTGDVAADFDLTITAGSTALEDPVLTNASTGEKIGFTITLSSGDSIRVHKEGGELYVEKTVSGATSNAFSALDLDSDFFALETGANLLSLTATSGASVASVYLTFYETFAGVLCDGV